MPTPAKKKTDPPENEQENEAPDFTEAQLQIINDTITAAVSQHVKRHMKPLTDQLAGLTTIQEQLEVLTANAAKQTPAKGAKEKEPGAKSEENPEVSELRARLDELAKSNAKLTKERADERIRMRDSDRDRKLTEQATAAGVDKNRLRGVTALLRDQVKYDRDGNPYMTVKRGGVDEDVDLEVGTAEFFKTDEGKSYLAPTQQGAGGARQAATGGRTNAASVAGGAARGAGGGGSNAPVRGADQQKADRKQAALKQLGEGVEALLGGGGSLEIG